MKRTSLFLFMVWESVALATPQAPFSKGMNLTGWFQKSNARQIHLYQYTPEDFRAIKAMGCDHIRLPMDLHHMAGPGPEFQLDTLFLALLDQVVDWAEAEGLFIILDNHTFDPAVDTKPDVEPILTACWRQMAQHFKNRSSLVLYEVLNEPHGISDGVWNAIQGRVIEAIRQEDPSHPIVVGPANWNSYANLSLMPAYSDTNLIYTFHFYDPMLFTHQGATWTSPGVQIAGVPFPYDALRMPPMPASFSGTWLESAYRNYSNEGTENYIRSKIDMAVQFMAGRKVPVWCGEFGVYNLYAQSEDRARWMRVVRTKFEEHGIPWTLWEYRGGFGIFEKGTSGNIETDVDTLVTNALGLTPPIQKEPVAEPDTVGIMLYDDFIGSGLLEESWTNNGVIDYYSTESPYRGTYCIRMTGHGQYGNLSFRFSRIRDFSLLVERGFLLDLWIRCDSPTTRLDIRFEDTKTEDPEDHPWRMRTTLSPSTVQWNGEWQHISVPLSDFTEHGSWDNNQWYNPQGLFDWSQVERFSIVAEYHPLQGIEVYLDDIQIAAPYTGVEEKSLPVRTFALLQNYPNPFNPKTTIAFVLERPSRVKMRIVDLTGKTVFTVEKFYPTSGIHTLDWEAKDSRGHRLPSGIYLCLLETAQQRAVRRMVLLQ